MTDSTFVVWRVAGGFRYLTTLVVERCACMPY
jgi:hypothetical protein